MTLLREAFRGFEEAFDRGRPPRTWAERDYQVVHWSVMSRGGHFGFLEQPELFVRDVREFFRTIMGEGQRETMSFFRIIILYS